MVNIHCNLQYRDLMMMKIPGLGAKDDLIPCSDVAGEVVAIGGGAASRRWKVGDRVMCAFNPAHLYDELAEEMFQHYLGGQADGVLTQYKCLPSAVSST